MSDAGEMTPTAVGTWQEAVMAWEPGEARERGAAAAKILGVDPATPVLRVTGGWAILAAALALGLAGDLLLRAWPWGINITLWLVGLSAATLALPRIKPLALPRARGTLWLAAAIGFSLMLVWRASPVLMTLNLLAVFLCLAMVAFRTRGGASRLASITEFAWNAAIAAAHAAGGVVVLLTMHVDWRNLTSKDRSERLVAIGRGLALAAAPVVVSGRCSLRRTSSSGICSKICCSSRCRTCSSM